MGKIGGARREGSSRGSRARSEGSNEGEAGRLASGSGSGSGSESESPLRERGRYGGGDQTPGTPVPRGRRSEAASRGTPLSTSTRGRGGGHARPRPRSESAESGDSSFSQAARSRNRRRDKNDNENENENANENENEEEDDDDGGEGGRRRRTQASQPGPDGRFKRLRQEPGSDVESGAGSEGRRLRRDDKGSGDEEDGSDGADSMLGSVSGSEVGPRGASGAVNRADGEDADASLPDAPEDIEDILNAEGEEEPEGEDLFGDEMDADYVANPELDVYDVAQLDEGKYEPMTGEERRAAEIALAKRDEQRRARDARMGGGARAYGGFFGGRVPAALAGDLVEERAEPADGAPILDRIRRQRERDRDRGERGRVGREERSRDRGEGEGSAQEDATVDVTMTEEDDSDAGFKLEDRRGPLRRWIELDAAKSEIRKRFHRFLLTFTDDHGRIVYRDRIRTMCGNNGESAGISYLHLAVALPTLAVWLVEAPTEMLALFDAGLLEVVLLLFPAYLQIRKSVRTRIIDLPFCDSLRDLRQNQLNCLIRVSGVVTRRTSVLPQLVAVKLECQSCNGIIGPILQQRSDGIINSLAQCPHCLSKGPFALDVQGTIYQNFQRICLQESPGSVPPGRIPRTKDVVLTGDMVDEVRPGEEIDVVGIFRHNFDLSLHHNNGFPVFSTLIEANHVSKKYDVLASMNVTEEDMDEIRKLSKHERIAERIFKSIAPSIHGHRDVKVALALSMFGGVSKMVRNRHKIRGDINVLILGDPGLAKSQFLKYVEKTSHRAVYATGQGASAVGLTAAVRMDPVTREWTLEGGALVLADRGVCLIDEFDKMNDQDRTSIHEAMEQQSISISKAGIVTSLQARCAVIAAANPIKGRYDPSRSFAHNVELTEPILDRFDILCVVRDVVDPLADERLAKFVVGSHRRSHPNESAEGNGNGIANGKGGPQSDPEVIPQALLRKYIVYAKKAVQPRLLRIDVEKIASLYGELRRASMVGGGVPMGVRYLESIIRMAEAHARMHLREFVRDEDTNMAIRVMLQSFVSAQKFSVSRQMARQFRRFLTHARDHNELLLFVLQNLVRDTMHFLQSRRGQVPDVLDIDLDDLEGRARELDILDLTSFFESPHFAANGFAVDWARRVVTRKWAGGGGGAGARESSAVPSVAQAPIPVS